jgi:hypothetical protein
MYGAEILVLTWVCHQAIVSEAEPAPARPVAAH